MKKKGFTLIEITVTVLLLALLMLLVVPKVKKIIEDKNRNAYETMVNSITTAAKSFVYLNSKEVDEAILNDSAFYVNILELAQNKLLDNKIVNPLTQENISLHDMVKVEKEGETYIFTYLGEVLAGDAISLFIDLDGGSVSSLQSGIYSVGTEIQLEIPRKKGYTFNHWEIVAGNSIVSADNKSIKLGSITTEIKAIYSGNVELIVNMDGSEYVDPLAIDPSNTYAPGVSITLNQVKKSVGTFNRWKIVSGNSTISGNILTMGTTATTIMPVFDLSSNKYTVAYDCEEASGYTISSFHSYNVPKQLSTNRCYKIDTGDDGMVYRFKGWTLTKNSNTVDFTDSQEVLNLTKDEDMIILYPVWENLFTITGNYEVFDETNITNYSTFGNWKMKIFGSTGNTSGTASITFNESTPLDVFLVGGGASGSAKSCGRASAPGGGGGSTLTFSSTVESNTAKEIIVGNGGSAVQGGCIEPYVSGNPGEATLAFGNTALGGISPRDVNNDSQEFGEENDFWYAGNGGYAWDYYGGAFHRYGSSLGIHGGGTGSWGYNYFDGTTNTGGGGGGGVYATSGAGGSGIAIIRNHR